MCRPKQKGLSRGALTDTCGIVLLPEHPIAVCHAKEAAGALRQASGVHADERTYASLIDACARSGRGDLALRVYHRALRERCTGALAVYSATIAACRADLTTTMDIYADLQRRASVSAGTGDCRARAHGSCVGGLCCRIVSGGQARRSLPSSRGALTAVYTNEAAWLEQPPHSPGCGTTSCVLHDRKAPMLAVWEIDRQRRQSALGCSPDSGRVCARRNGVQPDERLYATLIAAAGSAGRLQLAFELRDEMRLEGLVPGEVCLLIWLLHDTVPQHIPPRTAAGRAPRGLRHFMLCTQYQLLCD